MSLEAVAFGLLGLSVVHWCMLNGSLPLVAEQVITSVLCAGLYPNVVMVRHPEETYLKTIHGGGRVFWHQLLLVDLLGGA